MSRVLQFSRIWKFIAVSQFVWLTGCVNLPYYTQAVSGHIDLMRRSQPISTIIADPAADSKLKHNLSRVLLLREFATRELKLPDNKSYTYYADLQRPYAVWNVFAVPEFSFELKTWCFIKAGCVNYRGFFSQEEAERYAETLRNKGYDVFVGGIRAYSTLGWFNDPVLNTFMGYSEIELASMIFHELAHQVVYVPDDSVFNESFATAVEHEGIARWMAHNGTSAEQVVFDARQERRVIFTELILKYRAQLQVLYASNIDMVEKRLAKAQIFADLYTAFNQLRTENNKFSSYNQWFAQVMNNARLATVSIYTQLLPEFQALLAQQDGDMTHFFEAVKEISYLSQDDRVFVLQLALESERNLGENIVSNASFQYRD